MTSWLLALVVNSKVVNSKVTVMFEIRLRCEREKGGTLHVKSASAAMI